jgi:hypothetical protein
MFEPNVTNRRHIRCKRFHGDVLGQWTSFQENTRSLRSTDHRFAVICSSRDDTIGEFLRSGVGDGYGGVDGLQFFQNAA